MSIAWVGAVSGANCAGRVVAAAAMPAEVAVATEVDVGRFLAAVLVVAPGPAARVWCWLAAV
jgi:hypothetical protein